MLARRRRTNATSALAYLVQDVCGCTVRSVIGSDYSCAWHSLTVLADSQASARHREFTAPVEHADCCLSELTKAEGNAEPVDIDANPSCPHCGTCGESVLTQLFGCYPNHSDSFGGLPQPVNLRISSGSPSNLINSSGSPSFTYIIKSIFSLQWKTHF